jgi:mannose-6-phosphate isomerase
MSSTPLIAPVALPFNPVWRSYSGGQVLRNFRGQPGTADDHFPEDWLASIVCARNGGNSQGANEGLSHLGQTPPGQTVADALRASPSFWLGRREADRVGTGVLWKLLDSSVRLQFQAHPDAAYARKHLNSNAGKTECWYIVGTRGEACVYLGFQRPPSRAAWARMIREQNVDAMLTCFDRIPVQPGDCFVIPAGTPHAIGAGVFMMELMEPADWVVRCETVTAGVTLTPDQCFMGLDLERCLDVFDYRAYSLDQVGDHFKQSPRVVNAAGQFREEEVIRQPHHGFFRLHRLRGRGSANWEGGELLLLVALQGKGSLRSGGNAAQEVVGGQTWLLPGAADGWDWESAEGDWELLVARLPVRSPRARQGAIESATQAAL